MRLLLAAKTRRPRLCQGSDMTIEDYGWRSDGPCPEWCRNGDEHLSEHVRMGSDFWHRGEVTTLQSADMDHNWNPLTVDVFLSQRQQVDERGYYRHPTEVVVRGPEGYTPVQARTLAERIMRLADIAEDHP
jgi:hypothetical protein